MYKPQLKTFLYVYETGSFSAAASQLFITPSAVVQQINALEKDLGVILFDRSQRGVIPTPAGEYLAGQAREFILKSENIRKELLSFARQNHQICIGTSLFEKCRLLYSLWMLFSQKETNYEIQMVSLVLGQTIPARTDLIESVNSSVGWMKDWNFFRICDVAYGFAIPNGHRLCAKTRLVLDDLAGETVVSLDDGSSASILSMLETMRANKIRIRFPDSLGSSVLWESSFRHSILLVPVCWSDILLNMTVVPCDWSYQVPYGIFYRENPSPAAERFLDFIRKTYEGGNADDIVPVL